MTDEAPPENGPIVVSVDPELRPLIPGFLAKRRAEVEDLRAALAVGDMAALRAAGHSLKGLGGGYGFDALTDLGRQMEERIRAGDVAGVAATVEAIADYVMRVQVVYREA